MAVLVSGRDGVLPAETGTRAVVVDPDTATCMGVVVVDDAQVAALCPRSAPGWMREMLQGVRAEVVYVTPRPRLKLARSGDPSYTGLQVAACAAGEAAHFAASYAGLEYEAPETTVYIPMRHSNNCFVHAALTCMVRCGGGVLWERCGEQCTRMSDLSPGAEEVVKRHLRQCMLQFAAAGDKDALSVARHLVGHVLRRAADKAPDLDDGGQHDVAEFLLRLLEALEANVRSTDRGASLRWEIAAAEVAFEEVSGLTGVPSDACAAVMHVGSATMGHYIAYVRSDSGWDSIEDGRVIRDATPRGVSKVLFFKA
jgi:hypothetical protein